MQSKLTTLFVIFVVVIGGYVILTRGARTSDNSTESKATDFLMAREDSALYVPDQHPGKSVHVSYVFLAQSGFVTIGEVFSSDSHAFIGSSHLLTAGEHTALIVPTTKTLVSSDSHYYARLYADDGDGKFDPTKDMAMEPPSAEGAIMDFKVNPNAPDPATIEVML